MDNAPYISTIMDMSPTFTACVKEALSEMYSISTIPHHGIDRGTAIRTASDAEKRVKAILAFAVDMGDMMPDTHGKALAEWAQLASEARNGTLHVL